MSKTQKAVTNCTNFVDSPFCSANILLDLNSPFKTPISFVTARVFRSQCAQKRYTFNIISHILLLRAALLVGFAIDNLFVLSLKS